MVKRSNRIRVGILAYDLNELRGGTKLALTLGNQLKKAGCDVAYSCVHEKIKEMEKFFGDKYDFKIYKQEKTFIGNKSVHYTALWNHREPTLRLINEFKPHVIIEIGGVITSLLPAIQKGIPTIHYCMMPVSRYPLLSSSKVNPLSRMQLKFFRIIETYLIGKISALVTMCNFTESVVNKIWNKKGLIINPSIDISLFSKKIKKRKVILSVCRYHHMYNLDKLIQIYRDVSKIDNDYELHLTAELSERDRPYYEELKTSIKPGEKIYLHHDLSFKELLGLYHKAEIFWYTSLAHFGLILVEAQASGVSVIAFKGSSGAEEILIDKRTGFLVKDFNELRAKTKMLVNDPRLLKRMNKAARENAKRFSNELFREKFLKVIKETLKSK